MKRLLVFALMLSIGNASAAVAGGTLLQSGQRIITRQSAAVPAVSATPVVEAKRLRSAPAALQGQPTLAQSGMSKGKKILIGLGIAASFVGVALAIDGGVEDSTPSSLGQR